MQRIPTLLILSKKPQQLKALVVKTRSMRRNKSVRLMTKTKLAPKWKKLATKMNEKRKTTRCKKVDDLVPKVLRKQAVCRAVVNRDVLRQSRPTHAGRERHITLARKSVV